MNRTFTRRFAVIGALTVAAISLAGCRTDVTTTIDITSDRTAAVTVTVGFQGEIAAQMRDATNRQGLQAVFDQLGQGRLNVTIDDNGDTSTWTAQIPYELVETTRELTGVAAITLTPGSDGDVTVTTQLAEPARLTDVIASNIAAQGSDEADANAMSETALKSTFVNVTVNTPQPPTVTGDLAGEATVNGNQVTLTQDLAGFTPGQLVVNSPAGSGPPVPAIAAGALLLLAAAGAFLLWRRR